MADRTSTATSVADEVLFDPTTVVLVGVPSGWPARLRAANFVFYSLERRFLHGQVSREDVEDTQREYLKLAEDTFAALTRIDPRLLYFTLDDWARLNDDPQTKAMLARRRRAAIIRPANHVVGKLAIVMKLLARARRVVSFSSDIEMLEKLRSTQTEFLSGLTRLNNETIEKFSLGSRQAKSTETLGDRTSQT